MYILFNIDINCDRIDRRESLNLMKHVYCVEVHAYLKTVEDLTQMSTEIMLLYPVRCYISS